MPFNSVEIYMRNIANGIIGRVNVRHGESYAVASTPETYFPDLPSAIVELSALAGDPVAIVAANPASDDPDF